MPNPYNPFRMAKRPTKVENGMCGHGFCDWCPQGCYDPEPIGYKEALDFWKHPVTIRMKEIKKSEEKMNEDTIKEMLEKWSSLKSNMEYLEQEIKRAVIEHKSTVKVGNAVAEFIEPFSESEIRNDSRYISPDTPQCLIYTKNL